MDVFFAAAATAVLVAAGTWYLSHRAAAKRLKQLSDSADRAGSDLIAQRRAADETREVRDLVLSSMEEGVLLFDRSGATVFANEAARRHLGSVATGVDALLPLEFQRAVRRAGFTAAVIGAAAEVGAPSRTLRARATPVGDDGAVLLVISDVTEARRIDSIRRDFVANASHELKTPAASIQAAAETLRHAAADDPAAVPRFAEQLETEAMRLTRIVADLLDLSRLESGSDLGERVRLDAIVREDCARFRDQALRAGLTLSVDAADVTAVRGSARDLSLLVRNLVDNAIRYTGPGGTVRVTLVAEDGRVRLRVSDTGVGIPSRDLARIFERFYRVDRARSRETGGTGLGLAIVKHVAENHGGEVTVESELGVGTTFTVDLPVGA